LCPRNLQCTVDSVQLIFIFFLSERGEGMKVMIKLCVLAGIKFFYFFVPLLGMSVTVNGRFDRLNDRSPQ
jgi:hypothetical protein